MASVVSQDTFHVSEDTFDVSQDTFGWVKCTLERTRNYQWREIPEATRFREKPGSVHMHVAPARIYFIRTGETPSLFCVTSVVGLLKSRPPFRQLWEKPG
jgi:hypothetical protein